MAGRFRRAGGTVINANRFAAPGGAGEGQVPEQLQSANLMAQMNGPPAAVRPLRPPARPPARPADAAGVQPPRPGSENWQELQLRKSLGRSAAPLAADLDVHASVRGMASAFNVGQAPMGATGAPRRLALPPCPAALPRRPAPPPCARRRD
jgi:hypothetical protein